jgi:hypothetical protein
MTRIEKVLKDTESTEFYLEDVSVSDFKKDVQELIQAYSDNGAIDKAIEMLTKCKQQTKGDL